MNTKTNKIGIIYIYAHLITCICATRLLFIDEYDCTPVISIIIEMIIFAISKSIVFKAFCRLKK
jgi:hypothetical protein